MPIKNVQSTAANLVAKVLAEADMEAPPHRSAGAPPPGSPGSPDDQVAGDFAELEAVDKVMEEIRQFNIGQMGDLLLQMVDLYGDTEAQNNFDTVGVKADLKAAVAKLNAATGA